MAERKQHHIFDRHREEEKPAEEAMVYSETSYGSGGYGNDYSQTTEASAWPTTPAALSTTSTRRRRRSISARSTAARWALWPPELLLCTRQRRTPGAHRHKLEEEIAGAVAVGSGGYAFHEKHEKKEAEDAERSSTPFQHHEGAFQHHEGQGRRTSLFHFCSRKDPDLLHSSNTICTPSESLLSIDHFF